MKKLKIIDKIKNFFYDEEEIEIADFKSKKKRSPKTINKEKEIHIPPKGENEPNGEEIISERELFKADTTFKFPIVFEEEDLADHQNKRVNVLEIENTKIKSGTLTIEEHKVFIPSPIISPIYGIIELQTNKNSKPNEIKKVYSKDSNLDLDAVINNVYRYPDNEPKNIHLSKEKKIKKKEDGDLDLFKDLNNLKEEGSEQPAIDDDVRIKSIDELLESTDEQDFYTLIDSMYENVEEEEIN